MPPTTRLSDTSKLFIETSPNKALPHTSKSPPRCVNWLSATVKLLSRVVAPETSNEPFNRLVPSTIRLPHTSKFAPNVILLILISPGVIVKLPVSLLVALVVPKINLSSLSSQPMKALEASPRLTNIPESFEGVPVSPLFKLIMLSETSKLIVLTLVVAPVTFNLPSINNSPPILIFLFTRKFLLMVT